MKTPRPYQESAINSIFDWFKSGNKGNPLIVAPVGAGKSLIIAELIKRIHQQAAHTKIVMITHVKELLLQNAAELNEQYPSCDMGFYCAKLKQKKLHNDVTFASIQSVAKKARNFPKVPQIIIVDEAHLISHNDQTLYRKFIDDCKQLNPSCVVIGLTGTPFRADSGRLDEGEGKLFDGIAYEIDIKWMIEEGYLTKPFTPKINTKMSVEGVGIRKGDYIAGQLEKAVDIDETTQACVNEIIELGKDRNKWLIFTAGVQHCEHVRDAIRARGISCEMITGETPNDEREKIIKDYENGKFRCLVNVAVLTTGFNVPSIDLLAFMRPTRSPVLYIQCIGRGIRTVYADGYDLSTKYGRIDAIAASIKKDCMVLDFGGVVAELGPIDAIDIRKKSKSTSEEKGQAVMKRCPSCGAECAASQKFCYSCSYNFVSESLDHKASDKHLLTSDAPVERYEVLGMSCQKHFKGGDENATPTLRVNYVTAVANISEWICFEHIGFAREKAEIWHRDRGDFGCPKTVDEAMNRFLDYNHPYFVDVRKEGKYYRIAGYDWTKPKPKEPDNSHLAGETFADWDDIVF